MQMLEIRDVPTGKRHAINVSHILEIAPDNENEGSFITMTDGRSIWVHEQYKYILEQLTP
jgi:hypothetical protein